MALDESTDVKDIAQLAIYVRYFNEIELTFREELLNIVPLLTRTTGEDIFTALMGCLQEMEVTTTKLASISTDGAPAMVGRVSGVVARLKQAPGVSKLLSFLCIIYQSVLCGKLYGPFKEHMKRMMQLINFLKAKSALRHRELRAFLEELNADYDDLLTHNDVRWLSKGNSLARIWVLPREQQWI